MVSFTGFFFLLSYSGRICDQAFLVQENVSRQTGCPPDQHQHLLPLLKAVLLRLPPAEEVAPSGSGKAQFPVLESFMEAVASIVF